MSTLNQMLNSEALHWRCIGPPRGGRVVAVSGDYKDPMTFYFGACAGGIWKTTDGGTYWECVSDGYLKIGIRKTGHFHIKSLLGLVHFSIYF